MKRLGDITIETENGFIIDSFPLHISRFTEVIFGLPHGNLDKTFCLQFIDPYGDTTFNMLQKRILVKELEALTKIDGADQEKDYLVPVIELVRKYQDEVHVYVKFHGD